jgi:hypothetical protein
LGPRYELISEFNDFVGEIDHLLMLPMREFIKYSSKINKTSSIYATIELNAEDISLDYINDSSPIITTELIHNGELQEFMDYGLLEDVEDLEVNDVIVDDFNTDFDDIKANITGSFTMKATANVTESMSKNYSNSSPHELEISGDFSLELELDIEDESFSSSDFELTSVKVNSAVKLDEYEYNEDELCVSCKKRIGDSILYPDKGICSECASSGNYFICTHCGVVYEHEDYNGDGEHCQLCINKN